jgi:transcriptional regulator with XRE-family HTH domain
MQINRYICAVIRIKEIEIMRIKEVIKEKGLTMKEVAHRMGVKSSTLSRAINGNTTVVTLKRIADVLGVSISELMEKQETAHICPHCNGELYVKINVMKKFRYLKKG